MDDQVSGEPILVQAIFGEVLAFEGDLITEQLQEFGAHTRCELAFLSHFVDPGDTIIDLGAHIGTFSIPLAKKAGRAGLVIAVEADARNYELLAANAQRSGANVNIRTLNVIVGKEGGIYELIRDKNNTGMSQMFLALAKSDAGVRGTSLSEIAKGIPKVDVVKIVVQGMELEVLANAEQLLQMKPLLYVQVQRQTLEDHGTNPEQLGDFLRSRGFRLFVNVGERNAAHDDFIIEEIDSLADRGFLIDVLAIPHAHERLTRVNMANRR